MVKRMLKDQTQNAEIIKKKLKIVKEKKYQKARKEIEVRNKRQMGINGCRCQVTGTVEV